MKQRRSGVRAISALVEINPSHSCQKQDESEGRGSRKGQKKKKKEQECLRGGKKEGGRDKGNTGEASIRKMADRPQEGSLVPGPVDRPILAFSIVKLNLFY